MVDWCTRLAFDDHTIPQIEKSQVNAKIPDEKAEQFTANPTSTPRATQEIRLKCIPRTALQANV